jgi:hypothetical protein
MSQLACVLLLLGCPQSLSNNCSNSDRLGQILETIERRRASMDPVWVKYTRRQFVSNDEDRRVITLDQALHCEWSTKQGLFFSRAMVRKTQKGEALDTHAWWHVYDGKRSITKNSDHFSVSAGPEAKSLNSYLNLAEEGWLVESIRAARDADSFKQVDISDEQRDGRAVTAITMLLNNGSRHRLWLLRESDYAIHEIITDEPKSGRIFWRIFDVDYRIIDGLPYLNKSKNLVCRYANSKDLKPQAFEFDELLSLDQVITRADQIPDSLFRIKIPSGALVHDEDNDTYMTIP